MDSKKKWKPMMGIPDCTSKAMAEQFLHNRLNILRARHSDRAIEAMKDDIRVVQISGEGDDSGVWQVQFRGVGQRPPQKLLKKKSQRSDNQNVNSNQDMPIMRQEHDRGTEE
jgi:hypothetical protein